MLKTIEMQKLLCIKTQIIDINEMNLLPHYELMEMENR